MRRPVLPRLALIITSLPAMASAQEPPDSPDVDTRGWILGDRHRRCDGLGGPLTGVVFSSGRFNVTDIKRPSQEAGGGTATG